MAWNRCAKKGSFSVEMKHGPCQSPGTTLFARDISTTFVEKNELLADVIRLVGERFLEDEGELFRVRLSIDEALQNAFSHGNAEDPEKRIRLELFETDAKWGLVIRDEGSGFQGEDLPDPTSPAGLWREHGRGLLIMCMYMDEVTFFDNGKTVRLMKGKAAGARE